MTEQHNKQQDFDLTTGLIKGLTSTKAIEEVVYNITTQSDILKFVDPLLEDVYGSYNRQAKSQLRTAIKLFTKGILEDITHIEEAVKSLKRINTKVAVQFYKAYSQILAEYIDNGDYKNTNLITDFSKALKEFDKHAIQVDSNTSKLGTLIEILGQMQDETENSSVNPKGTAYCYYALKQFNKDYGINKKYLMMASKKAIKQALKQTAIMHSYTYKRFTQAELRGLIADTVAPQIVEYFTEGKGLAIPTRLNAKITIVHNAEELSLKEAFIKLGLYHKERFLARPKALNNRAIERYAYRPGRFLIKHIIETIAKYMEVHSGVSITLSDRTLDGIGRVVDKKFLTYPYRTVGKPIEQYNRTTVYGRNFNVLPEAHLRKVVYQGTVELDIKRAGQTILGNFYAELLNIPANQVAEFIDSFKAVPKDIARRIMSAQSGDRLTHNLIEDDLVGMFDNNFIEHLHTLTDIQKKEYLPAVRQFLTSRCQVSSKKYISNGVVEYPYAVFKKLSKGQIMAFVEQGFATAIIHNPYMVGHMLDSCFVEPDQVEAAKEIIFSNANKLFIKSFELHIKDVSWS